MEPAPNLTSRLATWRWAALATVLILGSAGLRIVYLAHACPLDLAPDEAHYWDWSRHLDWSYYSKGPLVAYLIRGGCELAGAWSQRVAGSEMVAVRLPAVACGALLLASLYVLTRRIYGGGGLATAVVAVGLTLPLVGAGSSIMTIDAPYTCCWGWALVLGHQAAIRQSRWAWPCLGLVVGIGILAKYTMVLFVPSLALFLLTTPCHRKVGGWRGFWVMAAVGAACCVPILIWNMGHGWVSWRHVHGQAGLEQGEPWRWAGPLTYLGAQFGLLLGFWFVIWAVALTAHHPGRESDKGIRYLWWMSVPMFSTFLLFAFKTGGGEPNWPVTAYESGLVLAAGWLARQLQSANAGYRRWILGNVGAACGLGLLVNAFMYRSDLAQPLLLRLSGPATAQRPLPLRRFDPTCRLRGWRTPLAAEVDQVCAALRAEGVEPVLAGTGWTIPGELGFYCHGHPVVYSLGLALGDRHSQYDLWHPNPLAEPTAFAGRTFVVVGTFPPSLTGAFERVEAPRVVQYDEHGQPMASWPMTVCRGFRGFPRPPGTGGVPSF